MRGDDGTACKKMTIEMLEIIMMMIMRTMLENEARKAIGASSHH